MVGPDRQMGHNHEAGKEGWDDQALFSKPVYRKNDRNIGKMGINSAFI